MWTTFEIGVEGMSKKYKGFKGSGYNKKSLPKYANKTLLKIIKNAMASKLKINCKY